MLGTVAIAYGAGDHASGTNELNALVDRQFGGQRGAGFFEVEGDEALDLRTLACRVGDATVWVCFGEGAHYDDLRVEDKRSPWHAAVEDPRTWVAVGVGAWDKPTRDAAIPFAKQLALRLFATQGEAVRLSRRNGSLDYGVLPKRQEVLAEWAKTGDLDRYRSERVELDYREAYQTERRRERQAGLYEAAREHRRGDGRSLFVLAKLDGASFSPCVDWFEVTEVERRYSLKFSGRLQDDSPLLTDLRRGTPVQAWMHQVVAWRWDQEAPRRLPPPD